MGPLGVVEVEKGYHSCALHHGKFIIDPLYQLQIGQGFELWIPFLQIQGNNLCSSHFHKHLTRHTGRLKVSFVQGSILGIGKHRAEPITQRQT